MLFDKKLMKIKSKSLIAFPAYWKMDYGSWLGFNHLKVKKPTKSRSKRINTDIRNKLNLQKNLFPSWVFRSRLCKKSAKKLAFLCDYFFEGIGTITLMFDSKDIYWRINRYLY